MAEGFWSTVLTAGVAAQLTDKYARLRMAVLDGPDPTPAAALREAARRWPGSLRECQWTAPADYRARESAVRASLEQEPRTYAQWRDHGHAAVCLWAELHALAADVLQWRAIAPASTRNDVQQFLRNLTVEDPGRRARWPAAEHVESWAVERVGVGLVETCLGHRAGMDPAALRRVLFDPAAAGPRRDE